MKVKNLLLLALLLIVAVACKYDDDALWNKVNSLDERVTSIEEKLTQMNSDINAMSVIVNALQNKVYVETVTETEKGYQIKFTDGKTVTIKNGENGQDGKDAPIISVDEFEGKYYWVQIIGETKTWLKDKNGDKLPVTGADAITPILKVDADGYWLISYDRGITFELLRDESGNPVKAVGKDGIDGIDGTNGVNGDSFFRDVKVENSELVLILKDGTELRIPMSTGGDGDVITVRGNIEGQVEGLALNSLIDGKKIDGNNFSIQTLSNNLPQLLYIEGENEEIIMMSRGYFANHSVQVNAQSTALALVTMHPLLVSRTEEEFYKIVEIVEKSSFFQPFLLEVEKCIEAKKDVLNTNNTELLVALNNLLENLVSTPQVQAVLTKANVTGINSDPFVIDTNGNTVTIRNKGLVPTYECQVYYGGREKWNKMIETRSSYGFLDGFTHTMGDINLGEPINFLLYEEGEYYFYCDRMTPKAIDDFSRRLWTDALTIVGIDGGGWIGFGANCIKDIATLLVDPVTYTEGGITNVLATISNWSFQAGATLKWGDAVKFIGKFNLIYNAIKGLGNEAARVVWGFTAPRVVEFCLCSYDNAITCCTEIEIEKANGDGQTGFPNQRLMLPLTVSVKTTADNGSGITHSSYQKIKFEVISGNGNVEEDIVGTDISTGTAYTYWILGESGEQKVKAVAVDMVTGVEVSQPVYFTATLKEAADITIRLDWNKLSGRTDIDLHATDPYGEEIAYYHMNSASGGWLDRDDVIGPGPEHIYWQSAPDGNYLVQVHYYGSESRAITSYRVTINVGGQTFGPYTGSIGFDQLVTIGTIVMPDGTVTRSASKPTFIERREVQQSHKVYPRKN